MLPGQVWGELSRGILFKMDPKLAPRGRGRSPWPLGASFGSILNRISLENPLQPAPEEVFTLFGNLGYTA